MSGASLYYLLLKIFQDFDHSYIVISSLVISEGTAFHFADLAKYQVRSGVGTYAVTYSFRRAFD